MVENFRICWIISLLLRVVYIPIYLILSSLLWLFFIPISPPLEIFFANPLFVSSHSYFLPVFHSLLFLLALFVRHITILAHSYHPISCKFLALLSLFFFSLFFYFHCFLVDNPKIVVNPFSLPFSLDCIFSLHFLEFWALIMPCWRWKRTWMETVLKSIKYWGFLQKERTVKLLFLGCRWGQKLPLPLYWPAAIRSFP